jgi:branched-subunit amino acid transport protein
MTTGAALAAVAVVALITYSARAGLILFLADRSLPADITRALRYVGPAVLSALTVNLLAGGQGVSGVTGQEVAAVAVGGLVAWRTKNLIASLAAGMITIWIIIVLS